jgi:hypothetical protein
MVESCSHCSHKLFAFLFLIFSNRKLFKIRVVNLNYAYMSCPVQTFCTTKISEICFDFQVCVKFDRYDSKLNSFYNSSWELFRSWEAQEVTNKTSTSCVHSVEITRNDTNKLCVNSLTGRQTASSSGYFIYFY